jgi:hypothetical protein
VSNSWLLSLSPGPEKSQVDVQFDGATPVCKLSSTTTSQEKDISSEKVTTSSIQAQGQYSWQVAELTSVSSQHCDVYIEPQPTKADSFSRLHADRSQGFEACPARNMMPGSLMQESANYIVEAADHVGQAQLHEAQGDYDAEFAFYKTGIACLLGGVQGMIL